MKHPHVCKCLIPRELGGGDTGGLMGGKWGSKREGVGWLLRGIGGGHLRLHPMGGVVI